MRQRRALTLRRAPICEAPEAKDISNEPPQAIEAYGAHRGKMSFANNRLLVRRLLDNGVRYVQLFGWSWRQVRPDLRHQFRYPSQGLEQRLTGPTDKARAIDALNA